MLAQCKRDTQLKQALAAPTVQLWMTLTRCVSFNIPMAVSIVRQHCIDL